jgi:hypothetical protein
MVAAFAVSRLGCNPWLVGRLNSSSWMHKCRCAVAVSFTSKASRQGMVEFSIGFFHVERRVSRVLSAEEYVDWFVPLYSPVIPKPDVASLALP